MFFVYRLRRPLGLRVDSHLILSDKIVRLSGCDRLQLFQNTKR
jgi:hypothetical protein